jgi:hypothetical protein
MMAAQVQHRAARVLMGAGLMGLAADVLTAAGKDMSAEEIRCLAAEAMDNAQRVSYLLGKLAGLLDEGEGP